MKAKRKAIAPIVFCFLILLTLVDIGSPPFLAAQDIVVESANPPAAEQGTVNLDVEIKGKGFGRDSEATFLVSCDPNDPSKPCGATGGITVKSTTFKGPNRLIANIDVAEGATISKFDIEVQSNGRIGKGIELFAVLAKGSGIGSSEALAAEVEFLDPSGKIRDDLDFGGPGGPYADRKLTGGCTRCITSCTGDSCDAIFLRPYASIPERCPEPQSVGKWQCESVEAFKSRAEKALQLQDPPADLRLLTIDFSRPTENTVCPNPDLPARDCTASLEFVRLRAPDVFKPDVESTSVSLQIDRPLATSAKECGMVEHWELKFDDTLKVEPDLDDPVNSRIVSTDSGKDVVLVYKVIWNRNRKVKMVPLGRFFMPFQMRVTKSDVIAVE